MDRIADLVQDRPYPHYDLIAIDCERETSVRSHLARSKGHGSEISKVVFRQPAKILLVVIVDIHSLLHCDRKLLALLKHNPS